ncbi:2-amino-4-hydroxy-6-hydroxymethyldihydropteridine diphosphokinase [uncultured Sulfitobacter sp.]|uniref:2-amino-4-hydroxy-6- hydroxymethyldihydropteridine diphosphokinase n=1 Tax=uncultured Sulfitobacter sp. TaxID=191468 RepID=UPI00261BF8B2|nr:2-amino-4-hydroxy-6-hydroxymethyldihydropteridine diphosphokinase [uncultured Sulfitobacter sp.]
MSQALGHGENGGLPLKTNDDVLIALGSNLTSSAGSPADTLNMALIALKEKGAVIRCRSPIYRTPAFPAGAGPDFANAAARLALPGPPEEVLAVLHGIEADLGRVRRARWGERMIDLDLIAIGDLLLPDLHTHARWRQLELSQQMAEAPEELVLPHPRLQDRAFVLVPLADVAPDWRHPALNRTVTEMLEALPQADRDSVVVMQ